MNERIKLLAEQAWNYVDSQNPYASDEHEMFQEKFSELIIKECIQICNQGTATQTSSGGAANMIRQNFGVKE